MIHNTNNIDNNTYVLTNTNSYYLLYSSIHSTNQIGIFPLFKYDKAKVTFIHIISVKV